MIEVRIPMDRIEEQENSVLKGQFIMARLKEKGMPVLGVLFPLGVTSGALTTFCDTMFGEMVYRWSDGVPD